MNHREAREKALESIKVQSIKKELSQNHIAKPHLLISKIHQAAIEHKYTPVTELLKKINVPYAHYLTLCKTHSSIPDVRQDTFGVSRVLTQPAKDKLTAVLRSGKNKTVRKKSKSKMRGYDYSGDGNDYSGDDKNDSFKVSDSNIQKMIDQHFR
jgi:hypothetical protein